MARKKIFLWAIVAILVTSIPVSATDATLQSSTLRSTSWPQWRGPFFNGSTNEKNLPGSWSQTEGIAWVSPLLYQNKLSIIAIRRSRPYRRPEADAPLDSYLMVLDPRTGNTLWKQQRPTNTYDESMETYSTPIPFSRNRRSRSTRRRR